MNTAIWTWHENEISCYEENVKYPITAVKLTKITTDKTKVLVDDDEDLPPWRIPYALTAAARACAMRSR